MKEYEVKESDLVNQYRNSKPRFKSGAEAIKFYTEELNQICFDYGKTPIEMFILAEESTLHDPVLLRVHTIYRRIQGLSEIHARKTRLEHIGKLPESSR